MVQKLLIFSGLIISATCSFLHTAPVPIILEPFREQPVSYDFSYHVNDAHTGDFKAQSEARRGDTVLGQYSLIQPDGVRRVVDYQANDLTGFLATVSNQPLINPIQINKAPQASPAPEIQDNQISQDSPRQQQQELQQQQQQQQQLQQQEQQQLQQQYHQQQQQQLQQQQLQQHHQQQQHQQQQQQQLQHQQHQQQQQQQLQQQQQYQEEASRSTTANAGVSIDNQCPNCASSTPPTISLSTVLHPYQNNLWL
ncbi:alpha-protein kinase 1-like [Pieris brassicae]|uniref:alpha-protein kinase 1-like n=1 Tax=Pieris brassicae TaxID=7116 RepID=UPI001E66166C|nr:alpha-protein kinase 1-like [Pieris brassicae]